MHFEYNASRNVCHHDTDKCGRVGAARHRKIKVVRFPGPKSSRFPGPEPDVRNKVFFRNPAYLVQVLAEPPDPRWPNGTDHTNRKGRGIAEDDKVQELVHQRLFDALINTFP